jgi:tRNA (adenine22-N1)-methyltransferase
MTLEPRLLAVAREIHSQVHVDIGSDHALLPKYLLERQHVQKMIVVEKNPGPFENAKNTLRHLNAKILLSDGLEPIDNHFDTLSLTGMGAKLIVSILSACPNKLPHHMVLQPNNNAEPIRHWALGKFHLVNEQMVKGFWNYEVLTFKKNTSQDPAYDSLSLEPALRFGPHLLKQKHPLLKKELEKQYKRLSRFQQTTKVLDDLSIVKKSLEVFDE